MYGRGRFQEIKNKRFVIFTPFVALIYKRYFAVYDWYVLTKKKENKR